MGLTFNDQHSDDFGLYFKTAAIPYIAPKRSSSVEVQGRDGQYVFEDGFDNIQIELSCVIISSKVLNRRKQARAITAWLANTGILVFDYEKDVQYRVVKVTNGIAAAMVGTADEFTVTFECEPYQEQTYYNDGLTWEEADGGWAYTNIPWNGYERIFTVADGQTIEVVNAGTYKALPTIKLSGTATSVNIGPFSYENLAGDVYVDCKNKVVYSLNGSAKVNKITDFTGEFPELVPGTNQFEISGTITDLLLEFDYKNTYL